MSVSLNTRLVPTDERYIEGFNAVVGAVARVRLYIGLVDSPPLAESAAFIRHILAGEGAQVLVITAADVVVGWCDVVRQQREGFRHVGQLGMGLLPDYRGRGLARPLAVATLDAARRLGIERVELEVFASNTRAIALYENLGFAAEGVKVRARKLDGAYDDEVFMCLLFDHG
jgi:RimJ/RimL family protein N-acetyltransferase